MKKFVALGVALFWVVPMASGQGKASANQAKLIAHGKYLVTRVSGCGDCHSPHT